MRDDEFTSGRRRFLALGGAAAAAAVLAACGSGDDASTEAAATTSTLAPDAGDVALLRRASALEELEFAVYKRALDGGLLAGSSDTAKALQAHHASHAALFQGHTSRLGGEPLTVPDPGLAGQYLNRLTDEAAVLRTALELAQVAAATYQAAVTNVADPRLNRILMSVAGVESRHAALLGTLVNVTLPGGSFATTERALK